MMNGLGSTTVKISACHAEQKQQQQVYFKLNIAYKACAAISEGYSRRVQEKKDNSINIYIYILNEQSQKQSSLSCGL